MGFPAALALAGKSFGAAAAAPKSLHTMQKDYSHYPIIPMAFNTSLNKPTIGKPNNETIT